jgi:hypothetical protein
MSITGLLFLALIHAPALARPASSTDAEVRRIEVEMTSLAGRNAWVGVDRNYNSMIQNNLQPSTQATKLAATAALRIGNTWAAYQRLFRALQHDEKADVSLELRTIRNQYGRVEIRRNTDVPAVLVEAVRSFDPNNNACLAFSKEQLLTTGRFDGMLPVGEYTINDSTFTVRAGLRPVIVSL